MFGTNSIEGKHYFRDAPKDSLFVTSVFFTLQGEVPNLALIVRAFLMIFAEMFVLIAIIIVLISQEPAGSIAIMIFSLMIMFLLNNILKKYFQFFGHQKHIYLSESNKNIFPPICHLY